MLFDLSNHFSGIADTRHVKDPFGVGLEVEILRAGHPDWMGWLKQNDANPLVKAMLKATVKVALQGRREKLTQEEIIDRAAEGVLSQVGGDLTDNLEVLKPGVANILIRSIGGKAFADVWWNCSNPGCENRWAASAPIESCPKCGTGSPLQERTPAVYVQGESGAKLLTNVRKADGKLAWVPRFLPDGKTDMPFGNRPTGDAILAWLLEEADQTQKFFADFREDAGKN